MIELRLPDGSPRVTGFTDEERASLSDERRARLDALDAAIAAEDQCDADLKAAEHAVRAAMQNKFDAESVLLKFRPPIDAVSVAKSQIASWRKYG